MSVNTQSVQDWLEGNPGHWDECPGYPVDLWQYEVTNNETRQSYRDWVVSQAELADMGDGQ